MKSTEKLLHSARARWLVRATLLGALFGCWWFGSAPACSGCRVEGVELALPERTPLHARLYVPEGAGADLPAVVVCHGYLGNTGFLEVPWAEDLTRAGIVALFLDRRGHGRSGGSWWPHASDSAPQQLTSLYPGIRAAVAYLSSRRPLVDPSRIALLGHSDGGTGAMMVASADWDVAATVSLSASVSPWEYVNHVVPRNLLLLYGGDDQFILHDTDLLLLKSATRGYLSGEGQVGDLGDGSARRLVRVDGRGHLDLVYSEHARRVALEWLADTFGLRGEIPLSPLRRKWVVLGTLLLLLLVLFWDGGPQAAGTWRESWRTRAVKLALVSALWVGGLAAASWAGPRLQNIPAQESNIVVSLLAAESLLMGGLATWLAFRQRGLRTRLTRATFLGDVAYGVVAAVLVQLAFEITFAPVYTTPLDLQRTVLFLGFLGLSVAAFAATCSAAAWVGDGRGQIAPGVSVEFVLAALTAIVTWQWFVRMSTLPVLVLACMLLFVGAYRAGGRSTTSTAVFGAVMYARSAALVCAFY